MFLLTGILLQMQTLLRGLMEGQFAESLVVDHDFWVMAVHVLLYFRGQNKHMFFSIYF